MTFFSTFCLTCNLTLCDSTRQHIYSVLVKQVTVPTLASKSDHWFEPWATILIIFLFHLLSLFSLSFNFSKKSFLQFFRRPDSRPLFGYSRAKTITNQDLDDITTKKLRVPITIIIALKRLLIECGKWSLVRNWTGSKPWTTNELCLPNSHWSKFYCDKKQ